MMLWENVYCRQYDTFSPALIDWVKTVKVGFCPMAREEGEEMIGTHMKSSPCSSYFQFKCGVSLGT